MKRRKLIAFDNSALQRLWDEAASVKIIRQAAGVREVLARIQSGEHRFLLTRALLWEVLQTPDVERRVVALGALPDHAGFATEHDGIVAMISEISEAGLRTLDALHVALAWDGRADVLFTTDSGILRFGDTWSGMIPGMSIADPIHWQEALQ